MKNKVRLLAIFSIIFFLNHCSFDKRSGIWKGYEKELERISQLEEKNQEKFGKKRKSLIFSSKDTFQKEIPAESLASLGSPYNNNSWTMPGLNYQNSSGIKPDS